MSSPKNFEIKESITELKKVLKKSSLLIGKRVQALIIFKEYEKEGGISKREVANKLGVNHNSVQSWRTMYIKGGMELVLSHNKGGNKPSIVTPEQDDKLKEKLNTAENNIVGYVELKQWFDKEHKTDINYKTLNGYVRRNYGAKIKVARKSHIKKNPEAVETLKKTLVQSVKISTKKKESNLKK
jgi:transposase